MKLTKAQKAMLRDTRDIVEITTYLHGQNRRTIRHLIAKGLVEVEKVYYLTPKGLEALAALKKADEA